MTREMDNARVQWVTVRTFDEPGSANVARLMLEAEDIDCSIEDENIGTTLWFLGCIKLRVAEENVERARELLDEHEIAQTEAAADARATPNDLLPPKEVVCPECSSSDVDPFSWKRRLAQAFVLFILFPIAGVFFPWLGWTVLALMVYFLLTKPDYRCLRCGKRWRK